MQRRVRVRDRAYWITTHELNGEWYAIGTFGAETITVAAGNERDAIRLWQEAAQSSGGGAATAMTESE